MHKMMPVAEPKISGMYPIYLDTIQCGAQKCAAHSLHRLTHERPAATTNRDSRRSVGVATAARYRANVTGNSARTDGLHPSSALGLDCTEAATSWRSWPQGHPAVAMGEAA